MSRYVVSGIALALCLGASSGVLADSPPRVDHTYPTPQPSYPTTAQSAGEQGDVTLGVYVSTSGRARKLRVEKSSGFHDLDMAAAEGVLNWHYVPATVEGDVASRWMQLTIHYELPKPLQGPQPAAATSQIN